MRNKVLLFVDNPVFGGVEQAVIQLIEGLDRSLWQPVLVYHPAEGLQPLIEKMDKLKIRRIETPKMSLGIRGINAIAPFLKILRSERPAVFHAHLSWPLACKWGMLAAILAQIPVLVATEGLFLDVPYSGMSKKQQKLISTKVGKYITVSSSIAEKMKATFQIPEKKIRVIYNGVEPAKFDHPPIPHRITEINQGITKPLILTVARLEEQKGHCDLINAAVEIPEAIFVFLGDGTERSALEEQSQKLGMAERIIFLGYQDNVANWLSACDVFVLPSLYEGLPISILEAMAAGKPVIATEIPGNDEVVIDGVTGYLVPPHNPAALAGAIRSMLADPAGKDRMGRAGREVVVQKFSLKAMIEQTTEVYRECLSDRYQRNG